MATSQRQIALSATMWRDPKWQALPHGAQWLYFTISADPMMTAAGIAPLLLRRWAYFSSDATTELTTTSLDALVSGGRAVVDHDDEWVPLPKLLADTGVINQPNRLRGAIKAAAECDSPLIREAFAKVVAEVDSDDPGILIATGRARSSRRAISPALRLGVYIRDNWTCQDCWRLIPARTAEERRGLRAPFDETGWLELDHVTPWSDGGADTEDNLRALCSPCNRIKGARHILGIDTAAVTR